MKVEYINEKCHEDLKKQNPIRFDIGFDSESGLGEAHWGSHRHMHVAEIFMKYLYKNEKN